MDSLQFLQELYTKNTKLETWQNTNAFFPP